MRRRESLEERIVWGVVGAIVAPFRRLWPGFFAGPKMTKDEVFTAWKSVLELKHHEDVEHLKSALVEADKIFDRALKGLGSGETLGDRLRAARRYFSAPAYHRAWEGHKVRNRLVHEVDHNLSSGAIKEAIEDIEAALRDLKLL